MTEHEMKELVVRQRTYFETGATLPVCQRKTSPYSSVPVLFQKFSKAISLRRCTHYESMELSFSTDALTFG